MKDLRPKTACRFSGNLPPYPKPKAHSLVRKARDSPVSTAQRKSHVPPSLHLQALLKLRHKEIAGDVKNKYEGIWRLSKLGAAVDKDPGKDFPGVSGGLLVQIAKVLEFPGSFDAADGGLHASNVLKEPKFVYIVEMDVDKLLSLEPRTWDFISELEPKVGLVEHMPEARKSGDLISIIHDFEKVHQGTVSSGGGHNTKNGSGRTYTHPTATKPKIAVVGSGPSGLFAALFLRNLVQKEK